MLQWLQQNRGLVLFGVILLFGIGKAMMESLRAQSAKRRQSDGQDRAEQESLRTGRVVVEEPHTPQASNQRALEEIALMRRQQLEELRRKAAARAAAASGEPVRTTASAGTSRQASRTAGSAIPPRPVQATRGMADLSRDRAESAKRAAQDAREKQEARAAQQREGEIKQRALAQVNAQAARAADKRQRAHDAARAKADHQREIDLGPVAHTPHRSNLGHAADGASRAAIVRPYLLAGMTRQELRRAILLQEMLSPPISMREDEPAPEEAST